MEAKAILNYTRISPRKVGIVLDLIRNKPVDLAEAILKHTPKSACEDLQKLLKSAIANAENNYNMDTNNLYVSECFVTPGPILKRFRPGPHGRGMRILKRTSHITLVVKEREDDLATVVEEKPATKAAAKPATKKATKPVAKTETTAKKASAKKDEAEAKKPATKPATKKATAKKVVDEVKEVEENAKQKASKVLADTEEAVKDTAAKVEEKASEVKEKAEAAVETIKDKAEKVVEDVKEDMKENKE